VYLLAAIAMSRDRGRPSGAGPVLVAPVHQRGEHRLQVAPGRGRPVLPPRPLPRVLITAAFENALFDQGIQPLAEYGAGGAGGSQNVFESPVAEHHFAKDEQ